MDALLLSPPVLLILLIALYFIGSLKVINEYERAVIFRLGKLLPYTKGPGLVLVESGELPS